MKQYNNPWAGPMSYPIPKNDSSDLLFCGRNDDIRQLSRLISENRLVTLYGISGVGKTSLLQAGVYPYLGCERYMPVFVRFDRSAAGTSDMFARLCSAIEESASQQGCSTGHGELDETNFLISLMEGLTCRKGDRDVCPIIILDQFEEMLRSRKDDADKLLKQIYSLTSDLRSTHGHTASRFVISIREDDLYLLEDRIDSNYLYGMKNCRYRLRALDREKAREVITMPGAGLLPTGENIVDTIIDIATDKEEDAISTITLSLVCSMLYDEMWRRDRSVITLEDFMDEKGELKEDNLFGKYYDEAIADISDDTAIYVENHFVANDRRVAMPLPKGGELYDELLKLANGNKRLLQKTGNSKIELIHDSFCAILTQRKKNRDYQAKQLQIAKEREKELDEKKRLYKVQSLYLAEKAIRLCNEGDSHKAKLLALEALGKSDTPEAEAALKYAADSTTVKLQSNSKAIFASFSPSGKMLAVGNYNGTIDVIDPFTGKCLGSLEGHAGAVNSVVFSMNEKLLVSASDDNTVKIWYLSTHSNPYTLKGHQGKALYACVSPDGTKVLSGSSDQTIRVWDCLKGSCIKVLSKHTSAVHSIAFAPNGKTFLSASDAEIIVWDAKTHSELSKIQLQQKDFTDLYIWKSGWDTGRIAFQNDGSTFLFKESRGNISIWDAKNYSVIKTISKDGKYEFLASAFSPSTDEVITVSDDPNHPVCYVDARSEEHQFTYNKKVSGHLSVPAAIAEDTRHMVCKGEDESLFAVGMPEDEASKADILPVPHAQHAIYTPDGKYIVVVSDDIHIVDPDTLSTVKIIKGKSQINEISFSPDGGYMLSASSENHIYIWDCATYQLVKTLTGHKGMVNSATFSPTGDAIVSGGKDHTVRIWNFETGKCIKSLRVHKDEVTFVGFCPDGHHFISASTDKSMRLWDAKSAKTIKLFDIGESVNHVYSGLNKNEVIIATPYNYQVWDIEDDKCISKHNGMVRQISPDRKSLFLVSGTPEDNLFDFGTNIQIVDASTSLCYRTLTGHSEEIKSISLHPHKNEIVSTSFDDSIRIWKYPSLQDLTEETKEQTKSYPLSEQERRKYYLE